MCRQPLSGLTPLQCDSGHSFDRAREGYVNLLPANKKSSLEPGDNALMIAARRRVHEAGVYQPLAESIETILADTEAVAAGSILDLGCGEGYYAGYLADHLPTVSILGVDMAKPAVRLAAKRYPRVDFAVASAFAVPLPEDSVGSVVSVFAPTAPAELQRLLPAGGVYLKVTPAPMHLWSLREALYTSPRPHAEEAVMVAGFSLASTRTVRFALAASQALVADIVAMTPFAYRGQREKRELLLQRESVQIEMVFTQSVLIRE
ncbi:MAG: putative RNA methyltransferase [Halioglobus sp.]